MQRTERHDLHARVWGVIGRREERERAWTRGTPGLLMKLPNLCMSSGSALLQVMALTKMVTSIVRDSHSGRKVASTVAICAHQTRAQGTQQPFDGWAKHCAVLPHAGLVLRHSTSTARMLGLYHAN